MFGRWGNGGTERGSDWLKVIYLVSSWPKVKCRFAQCSAGIHKRDGGPSSHVNHEIANLTACGQSGNLSSWEGTGPSGLLPLVAVPPLCPEGASFYSRTVGWSEGPQHLCNHKPESEMKVGSQLPLKPTEALLSNALVEPPCYTCFMQKCLPFLSLVDLQQVGNVTQNNYSGSHRPTLLPLEP